MRRATAPSNQPAVAGGAEDKARIGVAPEKATNTGRGGRCLPPATWTLAAVSYPRVGGSNPPRGTFLPDQRVTHLKQWVPECANTQEPATVTRMRGTDCTVEGNLSISFIRAFRQGARHESPTY